MGLVAPYLSPSFDFRDVEFILEIFHGALGPLLRDRLVRFLITRCIGMTTYFTFS